MKASPIARLTLATDPEYARFAEEQIVEYAQQLTRAGEATIENCLAVSRAHLQDLLTDRLRAAGHEILVATSARDGSRVGWLWLSPPPDLLGAGHEHTRWLSQLTIDEALRGQGWGRAVLLAAERYLTSAGVTHVWLRVFDWNIVARRLYMSSGYELAHQFSTDAHLRKALLHDGRPTTVCG